MGDFYPHSINKNILGLFNVTLILRASDSECTKLTQILLKLESGRRFITAIMESKQLSKYNPIHASPPARSEK